MKIFKITHFEESDTECLGDYFDIELQDENGKVITKFGDYYHDKGQEQAKGFFKGIEYITGELVEVIKKDVADR